MTGHEHPRTRVAGIGNVFFGDDGFGVAVAERLAREPVADGVIVADYGIRGVHLAFDLLDGCDLLVLIDALPIGEPPGTVALFEPDLPWAPADDDPVEADPGTGGPSHVDQPGVDPPVLDAHSMSPAVVLATLAGLGGSVERVLVVGCEPASIDEGIGLSDVVASAVEPAAKLVRDVLADSLAVPSVAPRGGTR